MWVQDLSFSLASAPAALFGSRFLLAPASRLVGSASAMVDLDPLGRRSV